MSGRQHSLFGGAEMAPRRASPVAPVVQRLAIVARPEGWRQATVGEHVCVRCGGAAGFGLGDAWYCRACAPADFLPPESRR